MADYFLKSSTGLSTNGGTSWADARDSMSNVLAIPVAAGDRIFVHNTHVEAPASARTLTFPGTPNNPNMVYSVTDAATPATGVTNGMQINSGSANLTVLGSVVMQGGSMSVGITSTAATLSLNSSLSVETVQLYKDFSFNLNGTNSGSSIGIGGSSSSNTVRSATYWENCSAKLSNTTQVILVSQEFNWRGGSIGAGHASSVSYLFRVGSQGRSAPILVEGVDFSNLGNLTDLVGGSGAGRVVFRNCTFSASWAGELYQGTAPPGLRVILHNCDKGAASSTYQMRVTSHWGVIKSVTDYTRVGGATDGVTQTSWEFATNSNPTPGLLGLFSEDLSIWNTTVGTPITITVDTLVDGTALTNAECWLEVEYQDSATSTKAAFASTKVPALNTPVTLDVSSASWTGSAGMTSPQRQKMSLTFTPQKVGAIIARVTVARKDAVVRIDPKLQVS